MVRNEHHFRTLSSSFPHDHNTIIGPEPQRDVPSGPILGEARSDLDSTDPAIREDALLRLGNGIRDAVVFPRLRAMGVADADLHTTAMGLVRAVQYGRDRDGSIAALLGVVRCGLNGTRSAAEVS